jgi:hypothetical protein
MSDPLDYTLHLVVLNIFILLLPIGWHVYTTKCKAKTTTLRSSSSSNRKKNNLKNTGNANDRQETKMNQNKEIELMSNPLHKKG